VVDNLVNRHWLYALVKAQLVTVPRVSRRLELRDLDYESLLIAWLNELLFLHERENLGFDEWDITDLGPQHLLATLRGAALQAGEKDVKAATYSGVQAYAVHSFVLFKESLCAPTPPIYAAVSSPFTSEGKGQFDNSLSAFK
jgi:hypothetical protein